MRSLPVAHLSAAPAPGPIRHRRIAMLIRLSDFYARTVAAGIRGFVRAQDRWVCEAIVPEMGEGWDWLLEGNWDGIVTFTYDASLIAFLEKSGIPSINVSNAPPLPGGIPRLVSDDYAVGRLAAEHFLERGLRHFAYFGNRSNVSHLRQKGFGDTLADAGFPHEELWPDFKIEKGGWMRTELPRMEKRVAGGFWPLGVFCVNDLYARHVIGCCYTHGIQMPEQVAVAGVNNSEVADGLAEIPFSSVELQIEKIGFEAAQLLAGMMDGEPAPAEPVLIPPKGLVVRQSSDLVAVNDAAVARALRLIRENALKQIDIGQVVLKVGISRRLLEMRFRAATGRSPYAEVVRLRIEKAKSLLATGDLPVSEVAEASGFGQAKQLHAIFTRETGMAPSFYRRLYRQPPTSP